MREIIKQSNRMSSYKVWIPPKLRKYFDRVNKNGFRKR